MADEVVAMCPSGHAVRGPAQFCPECGSVVVPSSQRRCANGHDLRGLDGYCAECGAATAVYPDRQQSETQAARSRGWFWLIIAAAAGLIVAGVLAIVPVHTTVTTADLRSEFRSGDAPVEAGGFDCG